MLASQFLEAHSSATTHLLRSRATKKARARRQGTMPRSTPTASMRAGVSCIAANATATCGQNIW